MEDTVKIDPEFTYTVAKIPPGQSQQHFININAGLDTKGALYKQQLLQDDWKPPEEEK